MKVNGKVMVHIVLVTRARRRLLKKEKQLLWENAVLRACGMLDCKVTELKVLETHMHMIIDVCASRSIENIILSIKRHVAVMAEMSESDFWRDSVFVQSAWAKEMDTLIEYIKNNKDE